MTRNRDDAIRDKARADAAEGRKDPPPDWNFWNTDKTIADRTHDRQVYRESHADKTREINQDKR
jgi:hypothetical protein